MLESLAESQDCNLEQKPLACCRWHSSNFLHPSHSLPGFWCCTWWPEWLLPFLLCCQKKKKKGKLFPEYFQQLVCVGQQNWWQDSFHFSCGHPSILLILCQKWCGMVCALARRIELVKEEGLTESKWPKIFLWRTCFCYCSVHEPDVTCSLDLFFFILTSPYTCSFPVACFVHSLISDPGSSQPWRTTTFVVVSDHFSQGSLSIGERTICECTFVGLGTEKIKHPHSQKT